MDKLDKVLELVRAGIGQDVIKAVLGLGATPEAPKVQNVSEPVPVIIEAPKAPGIDILALPFPLNVPIIGQHAEKYLREREKAERKTGYHRFTDSIRRLLVGAIMSDSLSLTERYYKDAKEAGYSAKTAKAMYCAISKTGSGESTKYLDGVYGELINEFKADPEKFLARLDPLSF